ncbi:MAG: restriction endonuclease subunit S [Shewanella sp.]|nr:restriction endonuclease subunit S [Shewanella sp.]
MDKLQPGGRLAIVVPDGFLFNQTSKIFREKLSRCASLEAIINLPSKTFHPYASVSSSLLILRNGSSLSPNKKIFIGVIDNEPKESQFSINLDKIVKNYIKHTKNIVFNEDVQTFTTQNFSADNWHHSKYLHQKFSDSEYKTSKEFKVIPLKEVLSLLSKGSNFVKDESGNIAYLNPANIREMHLNAENLLYTSPSKMKINYLPLEINDIVINAISNHRGSAAVIEDDLYVGLGANRHVIVLRPNTNLISPYYLALIINSEHVRKQLFDLTTGAVIPSLSMRTIEGLQIPIPSMEAQLKISNHHRNIKNQLDELHKKTIKLELKNKKFINGIGK